MNRGEAAYRELKEAGAKGLNRSELSIRLGLVDVPKAIEQARKYWLNDNERIVGHMETDRFLFVFRGKKQKRYFYQKDERN